MLTSFFRDLQYALRTLKRNPGFAVVSVLALALGIGANTAIFTVVNSVLLQPLRLHKPEQLIVVRERNLKAGFPQVSLSPGNYVDFRDHNHSFSGIAAMGSQGLNMSGGAEPERLRGLARHHRLLRCPGSKTLAGADVHNAGDAARIASSRHPELRTVTAALRGQPRRPGPDAETE